MRLEGVVGSTATISSNNLNSQITTGETRVGHERREIGNGIKVEELNYMEEKKYSEKEVIDIIEKSNYEFVAYDRRCEFSVHEKTKQIMIKVVNTVTDEVIRELPPEKVLDRVAGFLEISGILVDKKI